MARRAVPRLFAVCSALLAQLGIAAPAAGQTSRGAEIHGWVTTRTEVPLPGAEIAILGDSLSATTDTSGRFVLRGISPGQHVVRVRRIGYLPQYLVATLAAGEQKEVVIALMPGAHQLPDVDVTARLAKPIEYASTMKYDDFFRRQRVGLGYYISRKEIDRKRATETASLLIGVPGMRLWFGAPGWAPNAVRSTRCDHLSVWVDGWELHADLGTGMMGDPRTPAQVTGALLERILPIQIEMIEIYTSPARGQAEFVGSSCGAIMIWTR